jgi:hypothetical protein
VEWETFDSSPDFLFAGQDALFLAIWHAAPDMVGVRRIGLALERHAKRHPEGFAIVVVIEPGARPPGAEARALMARDLKKHESFTKCMAIVLEGEGFAIAAIRAVLGTLSLMSKQSAPTHIFPTTDACIAWLSRQPIFARTSAKELANTIERVRRATGQMRAVS